MEKIKTIFEFKIEGDKSVSAGLDLLIAKQKSLLAVKEDLLKMHDEERLKMEEYQKKLLEFEKTASKSFTKKMREEFVSTKDAVQSASTAIANTNEALKQATKTYEAVSAATKTTAVTLKDLKNASKEFNKELENVEIGSKAYGEYKTQLDTVKKAMKDATAQTKIQTDTLEVQKNSVEELRKKVSAATKEWKSYDRNSPEFKNKAKELAAYTEELKAVEQEVGIFNRSVGDYKQAVAGLSDVAAQLAPSLSQALDPLKKIEVGFKQLSMTPLLATVTILIGAFKFLIDAFKGTQENQEKLNYLFNAFDAVVVQVTEQVRNLGSVIYNVLVGAITAMQGLFSEQKKNEAAAYFDAAGASASRMAGVIDNVTNAIEKSNEISRLENKIKRDNISLTVEAAENEREILYLRKLAEIEGHNTLETRIDFLEQANELELKNLQFRRQQAQEELKIQQLRIAQKSDATTEDLQKEAELKAKMIELDTAYYNHVLENDKKIAEFEKRAREDGLREQQEVNNAYIQALANRQETERSLAQATSKTERELYQRMLDARIATLEEASKKSIKLTEEEQIAIEISALNQEKFFSDLKEKKLAKEQEEKEKEIARYVEAERKKAELAEQLQQERDVNARRSLMQQLDLAEKLAAKQLEVLEKLQVDTTIIILEPTRTFTKQLEDSLKTIKEFAGKAGDDVSGLSLGVLALMGSINELNNMSNKWGDDLVGKAMDIERVLGEMSNAIGGVSHALNASVSKSVSTYLASSLQEVQLYYSEQKKMQDQHFDMEQRDLEKRLQTEGVSRQRAALDKAKLDRKQYEEAKALKKKQIDEEYKLTSAQFKTKKAQDIINISIDTAVAIMKSFASLGPIIGAIQAGVVTALGAAQIGVVAAQQAPPKPRYERGGFVDNKGVIKGSSHANGGVPITVGDKEIEAEGDEGLLIVSKKAMKNPAMRSLFALTHQMNEDISGKNQSSDYFEQGGLLPYSHFYDKAEKEANKKYWYKFKSGRQKKAREMADRAYAQYIEGERRKLQEKEDEAVATVNEGISQNTILANAGITNIAEYESTLSKTENKTSKLDAEIKQQREYADARIALLKNELKYDETLLRIGDDRQKQTEKFTKEKLALDTKYLTELKNNNKITEEEYKSMLDQVTLGYGIKSADIINLKKKEIEETKKLINAERDTELAAVNETFKYQTQALEKFRKQWALDYDQFTKDAINNLEDAEKYASKLSGTDLQRYQQIIEIEKGIQKLNDEYKEKEAILNGDVILSREERARLLADQKRIEEEMKAAQLEQETAKKEFEKERAKTQSEALYQFELENSEKMLDMVKTQGELLKEQSNRWTIDKALAKEMQGELDKINQTYDQQIAAQDKIIANIEAEYSKTQLLHDQKMANLKAEEDALKSTFEKQKTQIESAYNAATSNLQSEITSLNAKILAIKVAGSAAGVNKYNETLEAITASINALPKFEQGGIMNVEGVAQVRGASHAQGGVKFYVGGTPIAEFEGGEKIAIANKFASQDPVVIEAMRTIQAANTHYSNGAVAQIQNDLTSERMASIMQNAIDSLSKTLLKIEKRPVQTYVVDSDLSKSLAKYNSFKKSNQL